MKRASDALNGLLRGLGMEGALSLGRISASWDSLFSGPLASHTSPESISGRTLTVMVDSPSWLQQANFFRNSMLEKLRPFGVDSLRFRQGSVEKRASKARSKKPVHRALDAEGEKDIEQMVSGIGDKELRDSVRKAARRSLSSGSGEGKDPKQQ